MYGEVGLLGTFGALAPKKCWAVSKPRTTADSRGRTIGSWFDRIGREIFDPLMVDRRIDGAYDKLDREAEPGSGGLPAADASPYRTLSDAEYRAGATDVAATASPTANDARRSDRLFVGAIGAAFAADDRRARRRPDVGQPSDRGPGRPRRRRVVRRSRRSRTRARRGICSARFVVLGVGDARRPGDRGAGRRCSSACRSNLTAPVVAWLALVGIGNVGGLLLEFRALRSARSASSRRSRPPRAPWRPSSRSSPGEPLSVAARVALAVVVVRGRSDHHRARRARDLDGAADRLGVPPGCRSARPSVRPRPVRHRSGSATPCRSSGSSCPARLIGVLGVARAAGAHPATAAAGPRAPLVVVAGVAEVDGFTSFAIGARESVAVSAVLVSQFATFALIALPLLRGAAILQLRGRACCRGRGYRSPGPGVALVIAGVARRHAASGR